MSRFNFFSESNLLIITNIVQGKRNLNSIVLCTPFFLTKNVLKNVFQINFETDNFEVFLKAIEILSNIISEILLIFFEHSF